MLKKDIIRDLRISRDKGRKDYARTYSQDNRRRPSFDAPWLFPQRPFKQFDIDVGELAYPGSSYGSETLTRITLDSQWRASLSQCLSRRLGNIFK